MKTFIVSSTFYWGEQHWYKVLIWKHPEDLVEHFLLNGMYGRTIHFNEFQG
jgi:hypothetical protein